MRLFAILDIDHPMVAWEVAIGRVLANPPKDEQGIEFIAPSLWLYSNIKSSINDKYMSDLESEFHIEKIRASKFPDKPSRLSGAFFFESRNDAINACKMWEWEEKLDYISEVNFHESSYVKLDSNWITLRIRSCEKPERDSFIENYYSGAELFPGRPLNEIICTGYGEVLNSKLRRLAYGKILQQKPDASLLLALGISCFEQDSKLYQDILRVTPFIRRIDNEVEGLFIMNFTHLENDEKRVAKIASRFIHNHGTSLMTPKLNKPGIPLIIKRPINKEGIFSLTDLTSHSFRMNVDDFIEMYQ
ncbi:hypothetical protein ACCW76_04360 [Pantoea sp. C8B4]|uniref:hypothetical protein n=1 Tax=Pantoea sp. C8B4 TaxID=3243083 RepID=UPI003EDA4D8C